MTMLEPPRIWWARPQKLCVLPRPGGGGRSHRTDRRVAEIAWMHAMGVRLVISTMPTRHNLQAYEDAGMQWHHVPIARALEGAEALRSLLPVLNERLQQPGAIAIHADHWSDFPVAVCAAHLRESAGVDPATSLQQAREAGLTVTPEACALLGIPPEAALTNGAAPAQPAPSPTIAPEAALTNGAAPAQPASTPAAAPAMGTPVATAGEPSSGAPVAAPAAAGAQMVPGGSIPGQAPGIGSEDGAPAIMPVSSNPPAQPTAMPIGAIPSTPPAADTPLMHPESSPGGPADAPQTAAAQTEAAQTEAAQTEAAQTAAAQAEGVPPLPLPPEPPAPVPPVLSAPPPPASPLPGTGPSAVPPPGTGPSAVPPPGSGFPTEMPEMADEPPANGISLILPGLLASRESDDGTVADAPPEGGLGVPPSEPAQAAEESELTPAADAIETAPLSGTPEEPPADGHS
jgi:hypothetical protein